MQLWEAIAGFNNVIEEWRTKPISQIVVEDVEEFCADWYRKLTYVTQNPTFNTLKGPMQFADYIMKQVEKFDEYMPLL